MSVQLDYRFPHHERLRHKRDFELLFKEGKRFQQFPLTLVWKKVENNQGELKVGFSVPKKHYKRAIDRNRIKRRMKEAYRIQQYEIKKVLKENGNSLLLIFVMNRSEDRSFHHLSPKILLLLRKIADQIANAG